MLTQPNRNMVRTRPDLLPIEGLAAWLVIRKALGPRTLAALGWEAGTPNPADLRPFGIDVSRYNLVEWNAVHGFAAPLVRYAMIRWGQAHKGAYDDVDRRLFYNWHAARAVMPETLTLEDGTIIDSIMGYHVFYPASPVAPQVANVARIARWLGGVKHGPFWIDMELNQGLTGAPIIDRTWEFIRGVADALGVPVGIYTGKWFMDRYRLPIRAWWETIWWWLAQYGSLGEMVGDVVIPAGIAPRKVLVHQTTSLLDGLLFGAPVGSRLDGDRLRIALAA